MDVIRPPDAAAFLRIAGPLLERDEARHNLILGIAGTLVRDPGAYDVLRTWVVSDGRPVAAALRTPPHPLVLADAATREGLEVLIGVVHDDDAETPGIVGNVPHVVEAARLWGRRSGDRVEVPLEQGVYALTSVSEVPRPAGAVRAAGPDDREDLLRWLREFTIESLPRPEDHLEGLERTLKTRFAVPEAGMWWWVVDEEPVSLAGASGPTPTGIRIGPVFTPPRHRRRGFATALVAEVSAMLLGRGHRACFLYTDLANPTSNAIYERIGYRRVADAAEVRFRR